MIVPSDQDYIDTKLILQGNKSLNPLLSELANWTIGYFNCKVISIYSDLNLINQKNRPRLVVVFEYYETVKEFKDKVGNYEKEKQNLIADKFRELVINHSRTGNNTLKDLFGNTDPIDLNSLLVVFTAFEPVARIDATWRISQEIIEELEKELSIQNIWKIYRDYSSATFFFHTNEQMNEAVNSRSMDRMKARWYDHLKPFDDFDYIKPDDPFLFFSSKEILDKEYEGNLFNYTRR